MATLYIKFCLFGKNIRIGFLSKVCLYPSMKDIIGLGVEDSRGRLIGTVASVHDMPDDSHIIEIKRNGDTLLLQESFIKEVDQLVHLTVTLDA